MKVNSSGGVDWPLDWPSISLHGWGDTRVPPTVERDRRACVHLSVRPSARASDLVISVTICSKPLELKPICGVTKCFIGFLMTDFRRHFTLKSVSIVGLTTFFCLAYEDNYVKTNEDIPILWVTEMFARDSSFWQYTVYSDKCYGFRARRRQI